MVDRISSSAPLHLLALLTHPSRCSPAVHASSLAAALPMLGTLVSTAKAVRLSGVLWLQPAARTEPFYFMLLLSRHAFQLLETVLQANACQQQHTMGEQDALGAKPEETDHHGQLQQQQQPGFLLRWAATVVQWHRCCAYLSYEGGGAQF